MGTRGDVERDEMEWTGQRDHQADPRPTLSPDGLWDYADDPEPAAKPRRCHVTTNGEFCWKSLGYGGVCEDHGEQW